VQQHFSSATEALQRLERVHENTYDQRALRERLTQTNASLVAQVQGYRVKLELLSSFPRRVGRVANITAMVGTMTVGIKTWLRKGYGNESISHAGKISAISLMKFDSTFLALSRSPSCQYFVLLR